jgi:AcrR family transcriptional regulator
MSTTAADSRAPADKVPRTERGRRTLRRLLDAAAHEFAERGFHEASISGITTRAGTALGSFYTYFNSKDEIFQALVKDMSEQVRLYASRSIVPDMTSLETEGAALAAFLGFAREHKEIYRIIDEAEFVDPASYRRHYESTAERILARLKKGAEAGDFRDDLNEAHAWAIMGMNVFLGLRYSIWSDEFSVESVVEAANSILRSGICKPVD